MDFLIGIGLQAYTELQPEESFHLAAEHRNAYVALQYEAPRVEEIGQGLADAAIITGSLGYKVELAPRLDTFIEVGYSYIETDIRPNVQTEIVYTRLVTHHKVARRPIPIRGRLNRGETGTAKTDYRLDNGVSLKIGVSYLINEHWSLSGAYRVLRADEFWRLYDTSIVEEGGGWWQENTSRDFSSFEVRLNYAF
jgi:hypothetical protein